MYVWVLAGLALGILVSGLVRRIPHSSLAEMTYVTFAAAVDEWKLRRKKAGRKPAAEPGMQEKRLRAAASRFTLF